MENSKKTVGNDKTGEAFTSHQSAIDTALNEKIKNEQGSQKIDPNSGQGDKRKRKTDVSEKKTGGGSQSNPGD